MAHGTPSDPAGIEPFYTSIRRGRPPHSRAPGRAGRAATRPSAAPRRWPSGPVPRSKGWPPSWRRWPPASTWCDTGPSTPRRASRRRWPSWSPTESIGSSAIVLTPHQSSLGSGEYLRRALEAAALGGRPGHARLPSPRGTAPRDWPRCWPIAPGPRWPRWPTPAADRPRRTVVFFTAHSLPSPGGGRRRPVPGPGGRVGGRHRPAARARRPTGHVVGSGVAERGSDSRSVDRPRPAPRDPAGGRGGRHRRSWCARSGSSPTISRSSTTSTSRPSAWPGRPESPSPGPAPSTTTRGSSACSPAWCRMRPVQGTPAERPLVTRSAPPA